MTSCRRRRRCRRVAFISRGRVYSTVVRRVGGCRSPGAGGMATHGPLAERRRRMHAIRAAVVDASGDPHFVGERKTDGHERPTSRCANNTEGVADGRRREGATGARSGSSLMSKYVLYVCTYVTGTGTGTCTCGARSTGTLHTGRLVVLLVRWGGWRYGGVRRSTWTPRHGRHGWMRGRCRGFLTVQ